ncbi:MAG: hypothetical protein JNJ98_00655 [Gemmatimonadetes bacterium]|nr:hypothetical protein [Gemmatimonadota bacterium]
MSRIVLVVTMLSVTMTTLDRVHPRCTDASTVVVGHTGHGMDLPVDHGVCRHPVGHGAPEGDDRCAAPAHCGVVGQLARMTEVAFVPAPTAMPAPGAAAMPHGRDQKPEPPPPKD